MATHKVIIKQKHKKDCAAIAAVERGDWDHPWFMKGDRYWGDRNGGGRGNTYRWMIFICNNTDCPAAGIVNIDWLEKLIYLGSRMAAQEAERLEK